MNRRNYNFYEQKGNRRRYSNFDKHSSDKNNFEGFCKGNAHQIKNYCKNNIEKLRNIEEIFKVLNQILWFAFKFVLLIFILKFFGFFLLFPFLFNF